MCIQSQAPQRHIIYLQKLVNFKNDFGHIFLFMILEGSAEGLIRSMAAHVKPAQRRERSQSSPH